MLAALGWGVDALRQAAGIAAAFQAKQLCSEHFVADREPERIVADDLPQLLPALLVQTMSWQVDGGARMVRVAYPGLTVATARYRSGQGCALLPGEGDEREAVTDGGEILAAPGAHATSDWPVAPRSDPALDRALNQLFDVDAHAHPPFRTRAVVIVHEGHIVAERYASGFDAGSRFAGWSIAKSVVHALTGVLVLQGRLHPDDPVPIGEWRADARRHITWQQLLQMRSGLDFDESYANPLSDVDRMLFGSPQAARIPMNAKLAAPPGTAWKYESGSTNLLAHAWRAVLPPEDYARFAEQALFKRIGMDSAVLEMDASGAYVGSSFIYATARDYARFGWLYAMDGVWNGERILPRGWARHAGEAAPGAAGGLYGAHFWRAVPAEHLRDFAGPVPEMLHATGFGGQRITIMPARRIVIVRLGAAARVDVFDPWPFTARVLQILAPGAPNGAGPSAAPPGS